MIFILFTCLLLTCFVTYSSWYGLRFPNLSYSNDSGNGLLFILHPWFNIVASLGWPFVMQLSSVRLATNLKFSVILFVLFLLLNGTFFSLCSLDDVLQWTPSSCPMNIAIAISPWLFQHPLPSAGLVSFTPHSQCQSQICSVVSIRSVEYWRISWGISYLGCCVPRYKWFTFISYYHSFT